MLFLSRFGQLSRERVPFLIFFHSLLFHASREIPEGLTDDELATVVSTLKRTFATLSKGVLYEHKSEDIRLQSLITRLGETLARRKEIETIPPATDADVLAVLESTLSAIDAHRSAIDEPQGHSVTNSKKSYLDLAGRVFRAAFADLPQPDVPGDTPRGGLIVEP